MILDPAFASSKRRGFFAGATDVGAITNLVDRLIRQHNLCSPLVEVLP